MPRVLLGESEPVPVDGDSLEEAAFAKSLYPKTSTDATKSIVWVLILNISYTL
jgi:hypothetical protein